MTYITAQFGRRILVQPTRGEKSRWTLADMMADAKRCNRRLVKNGDGWCAASLGGRKGPSYVAMNAMALEALEKGPLTAPDLAEIAGSSRASANGAFRRLEAAGLAKFAGKVKRGPRIANLWARAEKPGAK